MRVDESSNSLTAMRVDDSAKETKPNKSESFHSLRL